MRAVNSVSAIEPTCANTAESARGMMPRCAYESTPPVSVKVSPKADHAWPFQPSPYVSVIVSVHVAAMATAMTVLAYGEPPESVVPSLHERSQATSLANKPREIVTCEESGWPSGGLGGGGGNGGAGGADGGGSNGSGGTEGLAAAETSIVAVLLEPLVSVTVWPKPDHELPFQPSPKESLMSSVQVPMGTLKLAE